MVLLVIATATDSSLLYLGGAVIGGGGFGVAFLGALRALTAVIPNEHRAAVTSAFHTVAYAALSLPAIAGGVVVGSLGVLTTFELFGSVATALGSPRRCRPGGRGRRRNGRLTDSLTKRRADAAHEDPDGGGPSSATGRPR